MRTLAVAFLFVSLAFLAGLAAQAQPAPAATPAAAPAGSGAPPAAQSIQPAAAPSTAPVPTPVADERAMDYYRSGSLVWLAGYLALVLTSVLVLFTGLSARMRNVAYKIGRFQIPAIVIYIILFAVIDFVVGLPSSYYGLLRNRRFGLSDDTFGAWFKEEALSVPSGVLVVAILMILLYTLMRFSPRRWWLYIAIPFFLSEAGPRLMSYLKGPEIQGLKPVQDSALAADIRTLAERSGIANAELFQAPAVANGASVGNGEGKTRIIVPDPAASKLTRSQQLYLVARGLGSHRLHEQAKYLFPHLLVYILAFYLLSRTALFLIARFKDRWGFDKISDIASWPLFPVLLNVFLVLLRPIDYGYSRHLVHQSDLFGLELAQDNRACAESFIALSSKMVNPSPGPVFRLLRSPEPPLADRIEFCNTYRPWERGEPLKYGELITARRMVP
jgi:Zn-dependent protease with chaperone function